MIGTVLSELQTDLNANLATHISAVASARGVTLETAFTSYLPVRREQLVKRPAVYLAPIRTLTEARQYAAGKRWMRHLIAIGYVRNDADAESAQTHRLYLPEALMRWLDNIVVGALATGSISGIGENRNDFDISYDVWQDGSSIVTQIELRAWISSEDTI